MVTAATAPAFFIRMERYQSLWRAVKRAKPRQAQTHGVPFVELRHATGFVRGPHTPVRVRRSVLPDAPRPNARWRSEASVDDHPFAFSVHHGSVDGNVHFHVDVFPTAAAAELAFYKQCESLQANGYAPGWHQPALLQALMRPAAEVVEADYLTYAAWLDAQGDPRGTLIQAMQQGADEATVESLLQNHAYQLRPAWWQQLNATPRWHLGFVQALHLKRCCADDLRRIFRHPSLALLRELTIDDAELRRAAYRFVNGAYRSEPPAELWVKALSCRPPTLTTLRLNNRELANALAQIPNLDVIC